MKYFQVYGKTTDEVAKKLLSDYNGRAYIIKLVKESREMSLKKKWYHKGPIRPKTIIEFYYRAYCSLPENQEDRDILEDLQSPPSVSEEKSSKKIQEPKGNQNLVEKQEDIKQENLSEAYSSQVRIQADLEHLKNLIHHLYNKTNHTNPSIKNNDEPEHLEWLLTLGFSYGFSTKFLKSLHTDVPNIDMLRIILKERLKMQIAIEENFHFQQNTSYLFLGPTGVGKTTTLAKIAALCYQQGLQDFQFVSFDSYRLGADEQLKRFADIFEKPFTLVQSKSDIKKLIQNDKKKQDILFLDTAGESIAKDIKIPEVLNYIQYIEQPLVIFLVLDSHTRIEKLLAIRNQFAKFAINYYIFTKLDESKLVGAVLEFLSMQKEKAVFYTDGQDVPNDIKTLVSDKFFEYI